MKMFQRLAALALCAALTLPTALAAGESPSTPPAEESPSASTVVGLPILTPYPGYNDVVEEAWFYAPIKLCTETGLLQGNGDGTFLPGNVLIAGQAAIVAARLHSLLHGGDGKIENPEGTIYWTGSVNYLAQLATAQEDQAALNVLAAPESYISRVNFLRLLALGLEADTLPPVNIIASLPDTDDPTVLMFYRAGILNGVDKYGTFAGDRTLNRAECAAMLARIADPALRLRGEPADFSMFTAAGTTPDAVFFPGVTAETYLTKVNELIRRLEGVCAGNNMEFNWLNTYGEQTFLEYVKSSAMIELNVDPSLATEVCKNFDLQVYYSKLIDLTGGL